MSKKKKNKNPDNNKALRKEQLAKKQRNREILILVIAVLVLGVGCYFLFQPDEEEETVEISGENIPSSDFEEGSDTVEEEEVDTSTITSPLMEFEEGVTYTATIEIQDYGTIEIELEPDYAPITVSNFITLANEGFYDGLTFHRIIEDFMMQGGDPYGNGSGGSDRPVKGEFTDNGVDNPLTHTRGAVSMARSGAYDSGSSQFFICQEDCDWLDGSYAVFGYVTEGMEVVDTICTSAEPTDSNGTIDAEDQPIITSITIECK